MSAACQVPVVLIPLLSYLLPVKASQEGLPGTSIQQGGLLDQAARQPVAVPVMSAHCVMHRYGIVKYRQTCHYIMPWPDSAL